MDKCIRSTQKALAGRTVRRADETRTTWITWHRSPSQDEMSGGRDIECFNANKTLYFIGLGEPCEVGGLVIVVTPYILRKYISRPARSISILPLMSY